MKIRVGVLGTADIAERRMIPAIKKIADFEYVGVAIASRSEWGNIDEDSFNKLNEANLNRAQLFVEKFGGKYYTSFMDVILDPSIDVVYIPLPPSLHAKWIIEALNNNKNIIAEKPITCSYDDTCKIIDLANRNNLTIIENYGFVYHNQTKKMMDVIEQGILGRVQNVEATFCFPHRDNNDFRYKKSLGGGALLDCGGYTIKAASLFLKKNIRIIESKLTVTEGHEVDVFGSASFIDDDNIKANVFFGMDNDYKCELKINCENGYILSPRAFTAPDNLDVELTAYINGKTNMISVSSDDQFMRVLLEFKDALLDKEKSYKIKDEIRLQSRLVYEVLSNNSK